jgi:hypothetical protein
MNAKDIRMLIAAPGVPKYVFSGAARISPTRLYQLMTGADKPTEKEQAKIKAASEELSKAKGPAA